MTHKTIIKGLITIVVIALQSQISFAQIFQLGTAGIMKYGRTNPAPGLNPAAIGIGSFPNGTPPLAALHINTNAPFPTNTFFTSGEVFRTDCPDANDTYWRMLKGGL